jgi:hypothetical protein
MIAERVPSAVQASWKDSLPRRLVALLEAAAEEAGEAPYDPHSTGALLRSLRAALHHRTLHCDAGSGDGEEASLAGPDGLVSEVALYGLYQRRFPKIFYAVSVAAARGGIELWRWPSQYRQCSDALDQALRAPGLNNADIARSPQRKKKKEKRHLFLSWLRYFFLFPSSADMGGSFCCQSLGALARRS